ncbi:hypothetical protein B0H14DRAFT_2572096 [Mycena olivaceomarginata]|nr:hypothetical protein B0H14DRAFT_2572096 [Mycena olivaceomarginata]
MCRYVRKISGAVATSYASSGEAVPYGGGVSKGMVICAAVGGSVAASLVILAGGLFCLRYPARKTMGIAVEGAHNADLGTRCDQLEHEVCPGPESNGCPANKRFFDLGAGCWGSMRTGACNTDRGGHTSRHRQRAQIGLP